MRHRLQRQHRSWLVLPAWVVLLVLLPLSEISRADEKTRRIVGGVLQLLIESQRPERAGRGRPPSEPPNREVRQVVEVLDDYRGEASRLSEIMQQDVSRQTGLRAVIGDVLTFHAATESLFHRARHMTHPDQLAGSVADVDGRWRVVSWRLKQTRGVSPECRSSVDRLDAIANRLCGIYGIQPQIDRRALQRQADALTFYARALVDDLDIEFRRSARRQELVHAASRCRQAAVAFASEVAEESSYERLVRSFQEFDGLWAPLARRISSIDSPFVERNLLNIQEADRSIHELLWVPGGIDRQLLEQLTNGILIEVDRIYETVNLNVLIALPEAQEVPAAASDFYGCCQHFADCVRRNEPEDELFDAYGYLPDTWVAFSRLFRQLEHSQIRQSLVEIEQRLIALREPLRIPGGVDHEVMRDHAARLEHHAEHLTEDLDRWLRGELKFERDRRELLELSRSFQSRARVLHLAVLQNSPDDELQRLGEAVAAEWERLYRRIEQCDAADRDHIRELQSRISRELIGIEAMFL